MINAMKYFPEGIASGDTFINRIEERKNLAKKIKSNQHTVLIAPRRYGKTSLVTQVVNEMKTPCCSIDLLAAYSTEYVRDQIVDKVGRLAVELLPNISKAKEKLMNIFRQLKPEISIGVLGQKLSFNLSNSPLQDITELLLKLDETAKHFKKRAIIFMDEFQQISQLNNYHSIEASIRHAVERSENIIYIFSGSNRQLLEQMFGNHGRPLYRLCQIINLERMEKEPYTDHLQQLAKNRWKKTLPNETIEHIFTHTQLHPFYMNVLCQLLWECDAIVMADVVDKIWHDYVKTQRHIISHDVMELSPNQRKILTALARTPVKEIQSTHFIAPLKISASSAQQAVAVLLNKDLIYKCKEGFYRVLDPAVRYYLDVILWENN